MGLEEAQFQRLIDKTDALHQVLKHAIQTDDFTEADRLFAEREAILQQLNEKLSYIAQPDKYRSLYQTWQVKETKIINLVNSSLQDVDKKIKEIEQNRSVSNQYDSYLRQMPHGAFVDKKR